jgi:hypothetical protein
MKILCGTRVTGFQASGSDTGWAESADKSATKTSAVLQRLNRINSQRNGTRRASAGGDIYRTSMERTQHDGQLHVL